MSQSALASILVFDDDPAIAGVRAGGVELIVLDYQLTGMVTGLDYYVTLQEAGYDLPVIMVTGFGQQATIIDALRAGVRDFVTKADRYLEYLPEAVRRVLKQVRTEQQLAAAEERIVTQASLLDKASDAGHQQRHHGKTPIGGAFFSGPAAGKHRRIGGRNRPRVQQPAPGNLRIHPVRDERTRPGGAT